MKSDIPRLTCGHVYENVFLLGSVASTLVATAMQETGKSSRHCNE